MTNPLRGVILDNKYFNYISDSFRVSRTLRNNAQPVQRNTTLQKNFTANGLLSPSFTITLELANKYHVWNGGQDLGETTWLGVSRMVDLDNVFNYCGNSLPFNFVTPYGVTYSVVPMGTIDYEVFNPENPNADGMEFRATITLESI